jgi:hypothetical protein
MYNPYIMRLLAEEHKAKQTRLFRESKGFDKPGKARRLVAQVLKSLPILRL